MTDQTTLTRCPACDTRFRVTDAQLRVANGKVRCGNCMNVFNALEHQVGPRSATPAPPSPPSPRNEPAPPARTAPVERQEPSLPADHENFDDLVFQDDPEVDALEGSYTGTGKLFDKDELSDSFLALDEPDTDTPYTESVEGLREGVDESWAEQMLAEEQPGQAVKPARPQEPPKPAPTPSPAARPAPPPSAPQPELSLMAQDDVPPHAAPARASATAEPLFAEPTEHVRHRSGTAERTPTPYANLRAEPIAVRPPSTNWFRAGLWSLFVLVLLGAAIWQAFGPQFDRLARMEQLRPMYALACPYVGCSLPVMVDTARLESRRIVVRDHPDQRRTLLVEATIVNLAPFEQPFHAIALTFSNLNGDVVAQRIFTPEEYLQGEAARLTLMPPNTPFNIALSLKDPGRDAVNYNLKFMRPANLP